MTYAAAIDIGTHSALLLMAQCTGNPVMPVVDMARTTKLGESLTATKHISPAAMDRLIAILDTYRATLSEYPIQQLTVFGTAAFRLAENTPACRDTVAHKLGWSLRVLSGQEEANYTFQGISQLLTQPSGKSLAPGPTTPILVIDIGGGSTEVISGSLTRIQHQWSLPVGVEPPTLTIKPRSSGRQACKVGNLSGTEYFRMYL